MRGRIRRCSLLWAMAASLVVTWVVLPEAPAEFVPEAIKLESKARDGGWNEWIGIAGPAGFGLNTERITSLSADGQGIIWVGTSRGRVLTRSGAEWALQAHLDAQVTEVAVEASNRVWLSTGEGIRLLNRTEGKRWRVTAYRVYYQGQPALVSGGYAPGVDAERLWGYVDAIYIPPRKRTYAPFVISTEHGLFSWGGYHGVWHHFLPHYWGAGSEWLDTRELIPHRRPTCMIEDGAGNLWVGTDGDGLVRLNAHARDYAGRGSDHNAKDGTEFIYFGAKEVGCNFATVIALSSSTNPQVVWALLKARDRRWTLARFDGERWGAFPLEKEAWCIGEARPGVALLGTARGLVKVEWPAKKVELLQGPDQNISKAVVSPSGRVFCASWWRLYESAHAPD
jgi:hypothetical protein